MVKGVQEIGRVTVSLDLLYATRTTDTSSALGTSTVTVYGAGAQANPFYVNPPGVTATKQSVRFDLAGLLPQSQYPAISHGGNQVGYANLVADYNIDDNWHFTLSGVIGSDRMFDSSYGGLCSACLNLALNGTINASGSTAPVVSVTQPTTTTAVTMLPLTTANALDIWNPASTNRTSPAVLNSLTQGLRSPIPMINLPTIECRSTARYSICPERALRVAIGAESTVSGEKAISTGAGTLGPSSTASTASNFVYPRTVYAMYGEIEVPVIGPDMEVPLINKFDLDISGRYDDYSDVGTTANPKLAATWEVIEGLKFRGTYSTSFVAPALDSIGKPPGYTANSAAFNVPVAAYPNVTQLARSGLHRGLDHLRHPIVFQGIILSGATNLVPEKGRGWSVGTDYTPDFLPGLVLNATLFHAKFLGGVTSPNMAAATGAASLNSLLVFYPAGATTAQIQSFLANSGGNTTNAPQTGALPATTYYTWDFRQRNVLNLSIEGVDCYAAYRFDTDFGNFTLSDARHPVSDLRPTGRGGGTDLQRAQHHRL